MFTCWAQKTTTSISLHTVSMSLFITGSQGWFWWLYSWSFRLVSSKSFNLGYTFVFLNNDVLVWIWWNFFDLGSTLAVNSSWKNPSGEWHVGYKMVYEFFTDTLTSRLKVSCFQLMVIRWLPGNFRLHSLIANFIFWDRPMN